MEEELIARALLDEAKRKHQALRNHYIRCLVLYGYRTPASQRYGAAWRAYGPVLTARLKAWTALFLERQRKENT